MRGWLPCAEDGGRPEGGLVPHDGRGPAPLAAKGVLKRWNLPEDQRFVGIPDAVFDALMRLGVTNGELAVFIAMLARWNWKRGMRQAVSIRAIAQTLRRAGRSSVQTALEGLQRRGAIFYSRGTQHGGRVVVDLSVLRQAAMNVAAGRPAEPVKRAPRNRKAFGMGLSSNRAGPCPVTGQSPCPVTVPSTCPVTVPHSESSEDPQKTDAPRTSSLSGLGARQPGESEDAYRIRALALIMENTDALPA